MEENKVISYSEDEKLWKMEKYLSKSTKKVI